MHLTISSTPVRIPRRRQPPVVISASQTRPQSICHTRRFENHQLRIPSALPTTSSALCRFDVVIHASGATFPPPQSGLMSPSLFACSPHACSKLRHSPSRTPPPCPFEPERVISCARGRRRIARSSDELAASRTCSASPLMSRQVPRPSPPVPPPTLNPSHAAVSAKRPVTGTPVRHAPNTSNAPVAAALQGIRALW